MYIIIIQSFKFVVLLSIVLLAIATLGHAQPADERPIIIGAQNAPIKLDLYFSISCPHCLDFLDKNQEIINYNVLAGNLQLRYLEMPGGIGTSSDKSPEARERATKLSRNMSAVVQCIGQSTDANSYDILIKAFPQRLKREIGQSQTLLPDFADPQDEDWQYWVWSEKANSNPDTLPIRILKQYSNITKRIDCEPEKLHEVFQTRLRGLAKTGRAEVPTLLVNDEPIPGENEKYFENVKTLFDNVNRLSDIVKSRHTLTDLSVTQHQLLAQASIDRIQPKEKRITLRGSKGESTIQFNLDAINLVSNGLSIQTYPNAPMLEFLFFGTGISRLQHVDVIVSQKNTVILQLHDQASNLLQLTLEGRMATFGKYKSFVDGAKITSFIYRPNDSNGPKGLRLGGG